MLLFLEMQLTIWEDLPALTSIDGGQGFVKFSKEELKQAVRGLSNGKAPGPDHIFNEVLTAMAGCHPGTLLQLFNKCLRDGVFPKSP